MPSSTPKQHRAMEAAAHGDSNIGIPKKVAKEFVEADAKGKRYGKSKQSPESRRAGSALRSRLGVLPGKSRG